MRFSMVLSVGFRISISLLWVFSWKCSRASLSIKAALLTVKTVLSEGNGIGPTTFAPVLRAVSMICWHVESMILGS